MILDAKQYAEKVPLNGKYVNQRTIKRRAKDGTLPSHTLVHKFKGFYVFEIPEIPDHLINNFTIKMKPKQSQVRNSRQRSSGQQ